jgi:hypothetical protein
MMREMTIFTLIVTPHKRDRRWHTLQEIFLAFSEQESKESIDFSAENVIQSNL